MTEATTPTVPPFLVINYIICVSDGYYPMPGN
jgi:hypothetical protein